MVKTRPLSGLNLGIILILGDFIKISAYILTSYILLFQLQIRIVFYSVKTQFVQTRSKTFPWGKVFNRTSIFRVSFTFPHFPILLQSENVVIVYWSANAVCIYGETQRDTLTQTLRERLKKNYFWSYTYLPPCKNYPFLLLFAHMLQNAFN